MTDTGFSGDSEGEALSDWFEGLSDDEIQDCDDEAIALRNSLRSARVGVMVDRYVECTKANVGEDIRCATCGKIIRKTTYHKCFCSNGKTRKGGNCKDRFWNTVDTGRHARAVSRCHKALALNKSAHTRTMAQV